MKVVISYNVLNNTIKTLFFCRYGEKKPLGTIEEREAKKTGIESYLLLIQFVGDGDGDRMGMVSGAASSSESLVESEYQLLEYEERWA